MPAKTPASAAAMGVGVSFTLPYRLHLDSSWCTAARDALGNEVPVSRCRTPELRRTAKRLRFECIVTAHLGRLREFFVFAFRFRRGLWFEFFGVTIHAYE